MCEREEGEEKVGVVEREFPGRMWHEWKPLLMSINDFRKVQPNMHIEGTVKMGCNGWGWI